jgi:hypothetical protein
MQELVIVSKIIEFKPHPDNRNDSPRKEQVAQVDFAAIRWYLENLLPWPESNDDSAIVIAVEEKNGLWTEHYFRSIDEADQFIRSRSVDPNICGIFAGQAMMSGERCAENANEFKSIWIDIDLKKFARRTDMDAVLDRFDSLRMEVDLPEPSVIVKTGGGAHVYWLFSRTVDQSRWHEMAAALKARVKASGFPADVQCTANAAQVLRVAGTINRKKDYPSPRPVTLCQSIASPPLSYEPEVIETALARFADPPPDEKTSSKRTPPNLDAVRSAMRSIPPAVISSEEQWTAVARALAHTARNWPDMAETLWEILDEASSKAPGYNFADNRSRWMRYMREADRSGKPITLGTLFHLAKQHGWRDESQSPDENTAAAERNDRRTLSGGTYDANEALRLFNSHFFVADGKGAVQVACVGDDGSIAYMPPRDFSLKIRNIFVRVSDNQGRTKRVKGETFWLEHPDHQVRKVIFDPKAPAGASLAGQFNLWRGFAVEPRKGWSKQRRLVNHIWRVICRKDKAKFKYLMRWLGWAVQNPDKTPETVIVLKSNLQGTGKSTLSYVMRAIFGNHAHVIADKERLLGRFNANLETACFICAEEMIWAGDRGTADALKSLVTGDSLTLEVKNGARWEIPNRLHFIMTTNHDHAVHAGAHDRRFFVLDVDPAKASNPDWFGPLYRDLDDGGRAEFLYFLQHLSLESVWKLTDERFFVADCRPWR